MKRFIVLGFILPALLHCDDTVVFDTVPELMQWHDMEQAENKGDIAIVKIEDSKIVEILTEAESDAKYIESLPYATILETDKNLTNQKQLDTEPLAVKSVITSKKESNTPIDNEMAIVKIEDSKIVEILTEAESDAKYIESLPDATVLSIDKNLIYPDNQKQLDAEHLAVKGEGARNTTKTIENPISEIVQEKYNNKPITIVKYLGSPTSTCDTTIQEKIDFWELLDKSIENATSMILKKHDIEITQKNIGILKSEYYPNISLGYSGEYYHGFGRDGSSIGGSYYPATSQYRDSLDLSLRHELYRFGATDLKMKIGQKDIEIVKNELLLAQQDLANELLSDYTAVVKSQENIKFKEEMRMVQDRIIQKKWRLYESGQIAKTILLRDQLALANLEKDILQYQMNYKDAIKKIQILTNIDIDVKQAKFKIPAPKNREIVPFEKSAVAKNLKLKLEKKLQELELIRTDYKPAIYANSSYRFYGADKDSFRETIKNLEKNSWDVGVSLRWDLFSGFKTDNRVQQSKIEVKKLVEQYRLAKVDYESQKVKREMLLDAIDKILTVEAQILDQTCQQEEVMSRLESAGQVGSIEFDQIELNKIRSELNFRLGVIDSVYETLMGELIL